MLLIVNTTNLMIGITTTVTSSNNSFIRFPHDISEQNRYENKLINVTVIVITT